MTEQNSEELEMPIWLHMIAIILGFYILIFLAAGLIGIGESESKCEFDKNAKLVFPSWVVGCYVGKWMKQTPDYELRFR